MINDAGLTGVYAYFLIRQITGRVFFPGVICQLIGPDTGIPTTNIKIVACSTTPLERTRVRFEARQAINGSEVSRQIAENGRSRTLPSR